MPTVQEISQWMDTASRYIQNMQYQEAKPLLEKYISVVPDTPTDKNGINLYTFSDIVEYYMALVKCQDTKFKWSGIQTSEAYYLLSTIELENGNVQKASEYLDKSILFNPINEHARLKAAEIQIKYQDWEQVMRKLSDAYQYIYTEQAIAKYFRILSFVYEQMNRDDIALCLYSVSLIYEKSEVAANQVFAIQSEMGIKMEDFPMQERVKAVRYAGLPLSISRENLNTLGRIMKNDNINEKYPEKVNEVIRSFSVLSSAYELNY